MFRLFATPCVCANMAVQAQRVNSTKFMQWRSRTIKQKQYESNSHRLCSFLWERAEFYETANFDLWCWEVRKRLCNGKGVPRGVSTTQSYCGMGLAVAWLQIFWAGNQANMSRLPRKQDTLVIAAGVQAVQRPERRKRINKTYSAPLHYGTFFGAGWQGLIKENKQTIWLWSSAKTGKWFKALFLHKAKWMHENNQKRGAKFGSLNWNANKHIFLFIVLPVPHKLQSPKKQQNMMIISVNSPCKLVNNYWPYQHARWPAYMLSRRLTYLTKHLKRMHFISTCVYNS